MTEVCLICIWYFLFVKSPAAKETEVVIHKGLAAERFLRTGRFPFFLFFNSSVSSRRCVVEHPLGKPSRTVISNLAIVPQRRQ